MSSDLSTISVGNHTIDLWSETQFRNLSPVSDWRFNPLVGNQTKRPIYRVFSGRKWLERWVLPPLKLAYETCFFAESAPIQMVAEAGFEPARHIGDGL